jgi:Cdc6-like AAA superfamily ATPase
VTQIIIISIVIGQPKDLQFIWSFSRSLHRCLERVVRDGQSTSVLLVGSPASGKNLVTSRVLQNLRREYQQPGIIEIHLDGTFDTDETVCLRSITKQLRMAELDHDPTVSGITIQSINHSNFCIVFCFFILPSPLFFYSFHFCCPTHFFFFFDF